MAHGGKSFDAVWVAIKDSVAKSLVAVQPGLAHHYRTLLPPGHGAHSCFELLGECLIMASSLSSQQSKHVMDRLCHSVVSGRSIISYWQHLTAGYDILLDQRCKPWLLEVNHSPSFSVGSAVDAAVKEAVLLDTLRMVRCTAKTLSRLLMQPNQCHADVCHRA